MGGCPRAQGNNSTNARVRKGIGARDDEGNISRSKAG
jgi:hypothetical protein